MIPFWILRVAKIVRKILPVAKVAVPIVKDAIEDHKKKDQPKEEH